MSYKNLVAVAFLTEDSRFIADSNCLLGSWLQNLVPREWGTEIFVGTGRKLPSMIAKGHASGHGDISYTDLTASERLMKLEEYTQKALSEFSINCKESKFAGEPVWVVGFFD